MENNMIMVASASNCQIVINVPDLPLHRVWQKKGAKFPIDRKMLMQAYYDPSVEYLFKNGLLITNDKEFLIEVGLMEESGATEIVELTDAYLLRLIKIMPVSELKNELKKLSRPQLDELGEFAIERYTDLQMDRVDILSAATGKNIMESIKNFRRAQED